jgi:hypothetical protein
MRDIFFVVGTGRSGTNLCKNMLNLHPQIKAVHETHFISTLARMFGTQIITFDDFFNVAIEHYQSKGEIRWMHMHLRPRKLNVDTFENDFRAYCASMPQATVSEYIEQFFDYCYGKGDYLLGDKTPTYGLHMEELLKIFPNAKFLHLIRDGRFAAPSMQKHGGFVRLINGGYPQKVLDYSYLNTQGSFSTEPVTLEQCIDFWSYVAAEIRMQAQKIPQERYLEIRYEDLVLHPMRELTRISEFLAVSRNLIWFVRASLTPKKSSLRGRKKMSAEQYRELTARASETLQSFGYPTDET